MLCSQSVVAVGTFAQLRKRLGKQIDTPESIVVDGMTGRGYGSSGGLRSMSWYVELLAPATTDPREFQPPSLPLEQKVFVKMSSHDIVRLSLPNLDDSTTVEDYVWDTGFERFMVPLSDRFLAYAISIGHKRGVVRVVDAVSLDRVYEIPLGHTPSHAVVIDEHRFALVLRPFREDRDVEGKLMIAEIATGNVLREMPLGFHSWQNAYVSVHADGLLTCGTYDGKSVLGCWGGEVLGPPV